MEKNINHQAGSPAGESPAAGGQQADKGSPEGSSPEDCIILANDRDRRTLAWLRTQVTDDAIAAAVEQLAGARRPYITNVCKVLGLTIPDGMEVASREEALRHLAAIRAKLKAISR